MLRLLSIQNYALIEQIDVEFDSGLTIITGETGAGKSILLGALGLILGDRADTSVLRNPDKKCVIEGLFDISNYALEDFFKLNELDFDTQTTLRREIIPGGKSRAFINDTPVTLNVLREISEQLIDIHAQHETRLVNSTEFQLAIVDAFAGNKAILLEYKVSWKELNGLVNKKTDLMAKMKEAEQNRDFVEFQFNELENAKLLSLTELEELEEEFKVLSHAESIKIALMQALEVLDEGEFSAIQALVSAKSNIQKAAQFDKTSASHAERLDSVYVELKELIREVSDHSGQIHHDEERINYLGDRINNIQHLIQKHRASTLGELIQIRDNFESQLQELDSSTEQLDSLTEQIDQITAVLKKKAMNLSVERLAASAKVSQKVNELLGFLGMANAELKISCVPGENLRESGVDDLKFYLKSNVGSDFQAINKVASGGELSRIMLCLKAANAEKAVLPTIIFDEIDTGVSGEVASKMGIVLRDLGLKRQVISISHQPQIASKGNTHFKVTKEIIAGNTLSRITKLSDLERVNEIAAMISGATISEAAMANARLLLQE